MLELGRCFAAGGFLNFELCWLLPLILNKVQIRLGVVVFELVDLFMLQQLGLPSNHDANKGILLQELALLLW